MQLDISSKLPWIEKLLVTATLDPELDPHQDLKREDALYAVLHSRTLLFTTLDVVNAQSTCSLFCSYKHTLEAVARGYAKLKAARVSIIR